jgi:hypothetical protein
VGANRDHSTLDTWTTIDGSRIGGMLPLDAVYRPFLFRTRRQIEILTL